MPQPVDGFFEGVTGKRPGGAEGLVFPASMPRPEILEDRLALWEEADDALAFSSGMWAIATLLLTFVRPGDCVRPLGPALCRDRDADRQDPRPVRRARGSTSHRARRARKSCNRQGKKKGRVSLIYLESPANPTNMLVDVEAVSAARDAAFGDRRIARRSRSRTPRTLWAKPLAQGADLTIYSLTKYAGGHTTSSPGAWSVTRR